ncbi:MAG: Rrf2 family transcriptional regulator [Spirochaetaceae bacterium]|mgnify:CR=1 FL=1|nr:MAG: Rrf2 family transcriptional regulator [Spirochaetaceae bacterium]
MRITTKGRYAIRAITNLALENSDKPKAIKTIAKEEGISPEFLEQIFFRLKRAGLISSVRGPGGGFRLARETSEISIKEIFDVVGEGIDLTPCTSLPDEEDEFPRNPNAYTASGCSRTEACLTHVLWGNVSDHLNQYFSALTLDKIVAGSNMQDAADILLEKQHA